MPRPTSFRLDEQLLERLDAEARAASVSVTSLVATLLDEGLKSRRFPGIVYRDGGAGRRAGLLGGPDVWEIVRAVKQLTGSGEQRIRRLAGELEMPVDRVRLAVDFYAANPDEIEQRVAGDETAATRIREAVARRERLLSG